MGIKFEIKVVTTSNYLPGGAGRPGAPGSPGCPVSPGVPKNPISPLSPLGPGKPRGPVGPGKPICPVFPGSPYKWKNNYLMDWGLYFIPFFFIWKFILLNYLQQDP